MSIIYDESGTGTARDYGLYKLKWIRVSTNNLQCAKITSTEIKNMVTGIESISKGRQFMGKLEDLIITIEVLNAKAIYKDVPYVKLKNIKNIMGLQQYRRKYDYMLERRRIK